MFHNKKLGFSLAEVLAILAILAIFASFLCSYFNQFCAQLEMNRVQSHIDQLIQAAKSEAYLQHHAVVLCASADAQHCHAQSWSKTLILFADFNHNQQIDANDHILTILPLQLKYGNLVWKGALQRPYIVFQASSGQPIGHNGSFYYHSRPLSLQLRLVLNKMGQIRIEQQPFTQNSSV